MLDLWDQVPDAAERSGVERSDVLRFAAEVAFDADDAERSRSFMRAALRLVGPETPPLVASRVYTSYCLVCGGADDVIDFTEAMDRAVACAEGSASDELALALAAQARQRLHFGFFAEARRIADRAVELAREPRSCLRRGAGPPGARRPAHRARTARRGRAGKPHRPSTCSAGPGTRPSHAWPWPTGPGSG